ncbi:MAG: hypothetical protein ACKPKO_35290, partial [Candidatus Fonsibacter sp.]
LPQKEIIRIYVMSVPILMDELMRRGHVIRTDASKPELIYKLLNILASVQRIRRRRPMSSQQGSPMDFDHTPGG